MDSKEYETAVAPLQVELNQVARWLQDTGKRVLVIVEGRDTAGKGGAIDAFTSCLPPRQCRSVALSKPSELERSQWYFQRYVSHLPSAGELILFDRSWYNRAGVEKVMGYCTPAQVSQFLNQAPIFEKMLVDDGILLFKYWLSVDQKKQEERFADRLNDPTKRWKLSAIDIQAREKYVEYGSARDEMFNATHTKAAPWTVVDFNSQKAGRIALIKDFISRVPDFQLADVDIDFPPLKGKPNKEEFNGQVKPIN